jgi:PAS domain S-box-containing protein
VQQRTTHAETLFQPDPGTPDTSGMTRIAGDLGVRAFLFRGREPRARLRDALAVGALLGAGWAFVMLAGGSEHVTTQWFYIPILLAAVLLGPLGTLVTAIAAAIIAGPITPADVQDHLFESPALWVARGCFFVGIGMLVSWLVERHRDAGQRFQTAENAYRSLVEQLPGVVYLCEFGGEGEWLYVSPAIKNLLGYTPDEWLTHPHPFRSHVHAQDYLWIMQQETLSRRSGRTVDLEYRMRTRDGRWIHVRDTASVVRDARGEPIWMQGVISDVTERVEAEAKRGRGAA